jgi:hypothetical protein
MSDHFVKQMKRIGVETKSRSNLEPPIIISSSSSSNNISELIQLTIFSSTFILPCIDKHSFIMRLPVDVRSEILSLLCLETMVNMYQVSNYYRYMTKRHLTYYHTLIIPNINYGLDTPKFKPLTLIKKLCALISTHEHLRIIQMNHKIHDQVSSYKYHHFITTAINEAIIKNAKTLRIIDVKSISMMILMERIMWNASRCPNLTRIRFAELPSNSEHIQAYAEMSDKCPHLNEFSLNYKEKNSHHVSNKLLLTGLWLFMHLLHVCINCVYVYACDRLASTICNRS